MNEFPALRVMSVKVPVSDLTISRRWYAAVLGVGEAMEWTDPDGTVRGMAFLPLRGVSVALREDVAAAAATDGFGFFMLEVDAPSQLDACSTALDRLGIAHTPVIAGAQGVLVGFHDPDGHELRLLRSHPHDGHSRRRITRRESGCSAMTVSTGWATRRPPGQRRLGATVHAVTRPQSPSETVAAFRWSILMVVLLQVMVLFTAVLLAAGTTSQRTPSLQSPSPQPAPAAVTR